MNFASRTKTCKGPDRHDPQEPVAVRLIIGYVTAVLQLRPTMITYFMVYLSLKDLHTSNLKAYNVSRCDFDGQKNQHCKPAQCAMISVDFSAAADR